MTLCGHSPEQSSKMATLRSIPWPRILAEGVAIVVSILLAFWVQAWWEGLADKEQEVAILQALLRDFGEAREQFDRIESTHERLQENMEQLLDWAEDGFVPENRRAEVDGLLGSTFNRQVFDPPSGAVETILGTGRLDLISNTVLVPELTRWTALVDDLREQQLAVVDHFYQIVYPYLAARVNMQDLDKGIPYEGGVPWPQEETDAYQLVSSRDFQNIIYVHWVLVWNVEGSMAPVDTAIDQITNIVTAELGE